VLSSDGGKAYLYWRFFLEDMIVREMVKKFVCAVDPTIY
jgi:hypothetical protein